MDWGIDCPFFHAGSEVYMIDRIAKFHLNFEAIHPFLDGNGRIGRAVINYQLAQFGLPPIILRDKEKATYYKSFRDYNESKDISVLKKLLALSIQESLNKRISYLKSQRIITLAVYAKQDNRSLRSLLNAAKRQTIPAFREKGVWKIGT